MKCELEVHPFALIERTQALIVVRENPLNGGGRVGFVVQHCLLGQPRLYLRWSVRRLVADAQTEYRIYLGRQRQRFGNDFDVVTNATNVRTLNALITLQTFEGLAMVRGLFGLLAIFGNRLLSRINRVISSCALVVISTSQQRCLPAPATWYAVPLE